MKGSRVEGGVPGVVRERKKQYRMTVTVGLLVALGLVVLVGVQGVHSATKEPDFCVSCHVMEPVYGTWSHSAHREVADCNDCHTDNTNYFSKTYTKAAAGLKHLYHNSFGEVPSRIRVAQNNTGMIQNNCLRCHEDLVRNLNMDSERRCFDCHRYTPHGNYR